MNKESKKFRSKYSYIPLHPMMPTQYNAKERAELREWESKIMSSKFGDKKREDEIKIIEK